MSGNEMRQNVEKLSRLPKDAKIQKRPLLRSSISSPYAGRANPKVVYLSSKTPFMSAFKRVKQLLNQINKRKMQAISDSEKPGSDRNNSVANRSCLTGKLEEVVTQATGRAIDKALNLALFFQKQGGYCIKIKTGTVAAVDDIFHDPKIETEPKYSNTKGISASGSDQSGGKTNENNGTVAFVNNVDTIGSAGNLTESRVRHASMIEVAVFFADRNCDVKHYAFAQHGTR